VKFFAANKDNLELLRAWLKFSNDYDLKHSFFASLISLLEVTDDKQQSEIVHRIFSNLKTPQNFPNIGKDSLSVDYLVKQTDVPFENEELLGLSALINLMGWPWGAQAVLANTAATKYMLLRAPKAQVIV
jgi:hypothetical protein